MTKYVFIYHGGKMSEVPEETAKIMEAWGAWFTSMGDDVIDGGNPVGQSSTVHGDKTVSNNGGNNPVSGYSLINAANLDDALTKAKGCPVLDNGGHVELT